MPPRLDESYLLTSLLLQGTSPALRLPLWPPGKIRAMAQALGKHLEMKVSKNVKMKDCAT